MEDWKQIYQVAESLVLSAGKIIKNSLDEIIEIEEKTCATDLVTNVDKKIEKFLVDRIHNHFPHHKIIGEEGNKVKSNSNITWWIDPIDGTANFIKQKENFAIALAVYENDEGKVGYIYDVMRDELFHCLKGNGAYINSQKINNIENVQLAKSLIAFNISMISKITIISPNQLFALFKTILGIRSLGSASLHIAHVAVGRFDAFMGGALCPWDVAPGKVILEEVGGVVTTITGENINLEKFETVYTGSPKLLEEFTTFLNNTN